MVTLVAASMATAALAQQNIDQPAVNRTEASQIEMPQVPAQTGAGRAYLDPAGRYAPAPSPTATVVQTTADATSRAQGRAR